MDGKEQPHINLMRGDVLVLVGAAGVVLQEGNPKFATQLLAAVESVWEAIKKVLDNNYN